MLNTRTISRTCEVCADENAARHTLTAYTVTQWPVVECEACGFVYLSEAPDYSALQNELAWEKTQAIETKKREKKLVYKLDHLTRFRLTIGKRFEDERMRRIIGRGGDVLDVGCGNGVRIPAGSVPYGIEISDQMAANAAPAFAARGGRVEHASALDGLDRFEDGMFTAILMRSYLEHEIAPRKVLEKSLRKLAVGGKIFIKVPNYDCMGRHLMGTDWCGFRFPDHVNYFSLASMRRLAESIGFTFQSRNLIAMIDDNIYCVLTKPAAAT